MLRIVPFALCALFYGRSFAAVPVAAFLEGHCVECHDADVKKGGLDLSSLAFDAKNPVWIKVFERVRDGEMPPKKKPQPETKEKEVFLAALKEPLLKTDQADIAANGRVRSRRLTRVEYEHTMHDLLGIDIPLKTLLPEDRTSHGFETVADGQQLSHHQLARYLDVADLALDDAFDRATKGDATYAKHHTPEMLIKNRGGNYRGPELKNGEGITWPIGLQFFGRTPTWAPASGWYRITLRGVRGINPTADGAVWGTLRSGHCESNAPLLYMIGLVEATPTPRDMTFEAWIEENHRLELRPNDGTHKRAPTGAKGGNVSFAGRNLEKEGFSGIAHRGIDIERIYPIANAEGVRKKLFGGNGLEALKAENIDKLVNRFATRAFRRPVTEAQSAPYREIAAKSLQEGDSVLEALRAAYRAILCSPRFLTFIEVPGPLDDHAIASRLSFALWCSMPDQELLELAKQNKLREPQTLAQQVERLLSHAKAKRFIASFTDQWLKLNQIDFTTPDTRLFRDFDPVVQESMLQETRAYFTELLRRDLSITNLIDSDFAFLNGRLARHYAGDNQTGGQSDKEKRQKREALPVSWSESLIVSAPKPGDGLQKLTLSPASKRGGLVTQGAILKVTADGTSTSPVVRGVFINERLLGIHIPPPPPGVPAIEPDIRGATSIRDQLDKHRNNESCASCHQTIDPPGFALENYDPVGIWRKGYGKDGKGAKIDPSGRTPEGTAFTDLATWQQIYTQQPQHLARGFATHFLTYASGAPPRFSDEAALDDIAKKTTNIRSIIREVVLSAVFRRK
jgi:cytochrome c551/c552